MMRSAALGFLVLIASGVALEVAQDVVDEVPDQDGILLTKAPQNTAVSVGSTVTLTCWVSGANGFSEIIQWVEYTNNSTGRVISIGRLIAPCHPEKDRYKIIHRNPLQYDLFISNVNLNDGGLYSCSIVNARTERNKRAQAQLIVIGKENCTNDFSYPAMNVLLETTSYTAKCELPFGGNIVPFANWVGPQTFNQYQEISKPNTLLSYIKFYAHRNFSDKNWRLTFNFTNNFFPVEEDTATNIPSFQLTNDTPIVTVVWAPENIKISPIKDLYAVGDEIKCEAEGNPPVTSYSHTGGYSGDKYSGQVLVVPEKWSGRTQQCTCGACNYINERQFCASKNYACNTRVLTNWCAGKISPPQLLNSE